MANWDLYILSPIFIILASLLFYFVVKKNKTEKKWLLFSLQVLLTTTAAMIVVDANTKLLSALMPTSVMIGVMVSIFGSWFLFGAFFKWFYAVISIKLANRKIILQASNGFLLLALIFCAYSGDNLGISIFVLVTQSLLLGATLGAQSIYFLLLSEQKFNKAFPLKVSFSLGAIIVLATFLAQWFMGLFNVVGAQYHLDKYLAAAMIVTSFILSLWIVEIKTKVGGFSSRIRYQWLPYKRTVLVQMVVLTLLLGLIYTTFQSPIFRLYLTSIAHQQGLDDYFLLNLDRQYTAIFIFAQLTLGYVLFKILDNRVNIKYIFIVIIAAAGLIIYINVFVTNIWVIWISNVFYGAIFFMMYYFWFGFAIMWNARAIRKPVTGWVTSTLLFAQFVINTIFNLVIVIDNDIFTLKTTAEIMHASPVQLELFVNQLSQFIKIVLTIIFVLHCIYSILCFFWTPNIIAEYANIAAINKKMSQIEKIRVERRINSRIGLE